MLADRCPHAQSLPERLRNVKLWGKGFGLVFGCKGACEALRRLLRLSLSFGVPNWDNPWHWGGKWPQRAVQSRWWRFGWRSSPLGLQRGPPG
jgi:hypothetical protein